MTRALARAAAWLGWSALAAAAAAGVMLAGLALLAAAPMTRPFVASRVVAFLDDAIAGSLELEGVEVLARGGIELRGLEVYDPDGHLVLSAGRARVFVDLTGMRARAIGISVELESPSVVLEEEPGGGVSIARAFAPSRPPEPGAPPGGREGSGGWTIHVSRLAIRGGEIWWQDAAGGTRLEANELDLDARGLFGPRRTRVDLRLRGSLAAPAVGPIALDVVGGITDGALRIPVLRAELGGTALAAVAEGDLARRSGRVAVTRLGVARDLARTLAPRTPEGDDLAASAYAESDGALVTLALRAEPVGASPGGRADAAVAARLSAAGSFGFDVALDRLDPSRLAAAAPAGDVTLAARGAASGRSLRELRGRLVATVERSRLRRGEVSRAEIVARADRGTIDVTRASASARGIAIEGALRWREGGEVSGRVAADASDLGAALANAGMLLGERLAPVAGRARVEATLSGTASAPAVKALVDAPLLRAGGLTIAGVHLDSDVAGPLARPTARVEGRVASMRSGGREVARGLVVRGELADEVGAITATAALPGLRDPASLVARGRLGARRETLAVSELALAYPGARWDLVAPATLTFAGPAVDRLELAAGAQRVTIQGGLARGGALDAHAEVVRLDLARLPAGLLPPEPPIRGELSADLSVVGTARRPEVSATFSLTGGAVRSLDGLSMVGSARFSGAGRRLAASVASSRRDGGTADVDLDVPLPLGGRPDERVMVRARVRDVPLEEVLFAAESELPAAGLVGLDAVLEGTAGAPSLSLGATVADGEWEDLDGVALDVSVEDPGERLRLSGRASLAGARVVALDAELPLDLSDVLDRPGETLRALRVAPLEGSLAVTALDLGALSGRAGVPPQLAGVVDGSAALSGALVAPRATAAFDVARGAFAGYRDLGGRVEIALRDATVAASGKLTAGGADAVRFEASLRAPIERLASIDAIGAAPLDASVVVTRLALARAATQELPLSGTLDGRLTASGTLRAPRVDLALAGQGIAVEGRALGDARLDARYAGARASAEVDLAPAAGGTLRATIALAADLGLGAARVPLGDAPAELTAVAEALDLGFLPAAAPGTVRSAGGKLAMDVRAKGPLARLVPRGTLKVQDGRLSVSEYGEWTGIAIDAAITDDAVELSRLEIRRGSGRLTVSGALRGLRSDRAALEAHLASDDFTLTRAGMDVATIDVRLDASGGYEKNVLSADVRIPRGVVRLPDRTPRALQTLERRKDIVVGKAADRRRRAKVGRSAATLAAASSARPFTIQARVRVDRNLFVKSSDPRVDLELKGDVQYERIGSEEYAQGSIEVIRGTVEPIGGRTFVIERGRVQFTNGPPSAAMLDVEARYTNPAAVVTVTVEGPVTKPIPKFTSKPQLEEAQIAMLIATGRTEFKAGSGAVQTLSGAEAGKAALAALVTQAFKNLVADKLPLDTVALDSEGLRAGKYVTDKVYVGYTRRFDADPQRGENADEVRVEYQIRPGWTFESRYGNAQSGGASLMWTHEY